MYMNKKSYEIIGTTDWFDGGVGGQNFRYVVVKWAHSPHPYSRSMQLKSGALIYDHYYMTEGEATYDMYQSYLRERDLSKLARKTMKKNTTAKRVGAKKGKAKPTNPFKKKREEKPLMKCGHTANAIDADGNPVCAICIGINPGATKIDTKKPSLDGRTARCSSCGRTTPSSYGLPFFEYQGYTPSCIRPNLLLQYTHLIRELQQTTFEPKRERLSEQMAAVRKLIRKYTPVDTYYCGCRGWE
jgi:hypothetical protein